MLSQDLKVLIRAKYDELGCYREVARICKVAPNTVRAIVQDLYKKDKKQPGPKKLLDRRQITRMKKKTQALIASGQRVTADKIMDECAITNASARTVRRHLQSMHYLYKEAVHKIVLSAEHKRKRVELAKVWIQAQHEWNKTIFTDEKRFNLDGPDSWSSYMHETQPVVRNRRQQGGGNLQVHGILLPGPFFVFELDQRSNSDDFILFLRPTSNH